MGDVQGQTGMRRRQGRQEGVCLRVELRKDVAKVHLLSAFWRKGLDGTEGQRNLDDQT